MNNFFNFNKLNNFQNFNKILHIYMSIVNKTNFNIIIQ